jgi:outer membrane protein assembly factor BamB
MKKSVLFVFLNLVLLGNCVLAAEWFQGAGPSGTFVVSEGEAPLRWSVVRNENIAWRRTLPETGQSTVVGAAGKVFFTINKPVEQDSSLGQDIVAYCCEAVSGKVLWTRAISGRHPLRLSGCFGDSSAPPPVTDGKRVVFFNASGTIACFDLKGEEQWSVERLVVGRTQPFLREGLVHYIRQIYPPDGQGHFTHEHTDAPLEQWTQLQALEITSGNVKWTTNCGVNMGSAPLPQWLSDGREVAFVGRGGGHGPPEKPEGISMIDLTDGKTIWSLALPGFMATQTISVHGEHALVFHGSDVLRVKVADGTIAKRISIVEKIPVRLQREGRWVTESITMSASKKGREITQHSNLLVGDFVWFRNYRRNYLGRVNLKTDQVEYLQLPVQLVRTREGDDVLLWSAEGSIAPWGRKKGKGGLKQNYWSLVHNEMKNSRGFEVVGDERSRGNGWGHVATQVPTAIGDHLYVPVMGGTVYVLKHGVERLDERALVSLNDLGPAGEAWNRASLSFSKGRLFAHTIKEVICIK